MTDLSEPDSILKRRDMASRAAELWRPPLFTKPVSLAQRLGAACRRFLDLQAGSIWRDLALVLPHVRGKVLDVGCGAQPYRQLLPRDIPYIGIDTSDGPAHFGYEFPDTRYFEGDRWPVEDTSVDFVLCTETLEHVANPEVPLGEAFRCLVAGGTLLLTVPFAARWHFIPYDYWRFTPSGLDRLLGQAGFVDRRVYARGNAVTVACYKAMALVLRLALPQNPSWPARAALRTLSLPFLPVLLGLAAVANITLAGEGGDDCLGYTVLAKRPSV